MFNRNGMLLLIFLLALLTLLPVGAADNDTFDDIDDNLGVVEDADYLSQNSSQLIIDDNDVSSVINKSSDDSVDDTKYYVYTQSGTKIVGDNFKQYAVDYNAGERGGYFSVSLVDNNNKPLSYKNVKVGFNGKISDYYTDNDGKIYVQINLAAANKYTFVVTFLGDSSYKASTNTFLVNVVKKPVLISASAKTFKSSAKTKKYTITVKTTKCSSNNGKVYLKAYKKVTLKLNGKTYTAKINPNGKATFNLKITKKGNFNAVIKFAGDATYKSLTKNVKITIKK